MEMNKLVYKTLKLSSFFLLFIILTGCGDLEDPGPVEIEDEIPQSSRDYIQNTGLVDLNNEKLIAYFDNSIYQNNSQSYILTDKSLIIYCEKDKKICYNDVGSLTGSIILPHNSIVNITLEEEIVFGDPSIKLETRIYNEFLTGYEFWLHFSTEDNRNLFYQALMKPRLSP